MTKKQSKVEKLEARIGELCAEIAELETRQGVADAEKHSLESEYFHQAGVSARRQTGKPGAALDKATDAYEAAKETATALRHGLLQARGELEEKQGALKLAIQEEKSGELEAIKDRAREIAGELEACIDKSAELLREYDAISRQSYNLNGSALRAATHVARLATDKLHVKAGLSSPCLSKLRRQDVGEYEITDSMRVG